MDVDKKKGIWLADGKVKEGGLLLLYERRKEGEGEGLGEIDCTY